VKGRAIREADLTEKMAAFEAYGSLCGNAGVAALDAMLNGKSVIHDIDVRHTWVLLGDPTTRLH